MIALHRNEKRHHLQLGDQESWHTFFLKDYPPSFNDAFGFLVAFDEIRLPPGESTEPSPGDEAEVITYLFRGALA